MADPPKNWKCTHCFHPPAPRKKIPYFCGNHWYCSKHCYEDEMKNPHVSHILDPKHPSHDPHARDKHPPKDKHHPEAESHANKHKLAMIEHALFDMDHGHHQSHHSRPHGKKASNNIFANQRYESTSFGHNV
jgi:hypothetical protein